MSDTSYGAGEERLVYAHAKNIRYCTPDGAVIHLKAAKAVGEAFGIDWKAIVKECSRWYEEGLWSKQRQAKMKPRRPAARLRAAIQWAELHDPRLYPREEQTAKRLIESQTYRERLIRGGRA